MKLNAIEIMKRGSGHATKLLVLTLAIFVVTTVSVSAEVFLKGNYIEVGIHNAGSFGTAGTQPAGFHGNVGGRLGFVSDYGKDGWAVGSPPFAGGYFLPGAPEEGWAVEWTSPSGSELNFGNFGATGYVRVPVTSLVNTSSGSTQSAVWEGTATSGSEALRVTQNVNFDVDDLFFVINVNLTNTGTSTLHSVEYMRNVDPDQEQPWTGNFATRNWVEFQPPRAASGFRSSLTARPASNTDKALALAEGTTHGFTLGLGTIDPRAVVAASHGFANRDPDSILNVPRQPYYNGPGSYQDSAIVLAYDLGDLAPGQSVSFDYVYILAKEDLALALGTLGAVDILQPTGTISGSDVIFQATTDELDDTEQIEFFVDGSSVGLDNVADTGGVYSVVFDSRAWENGTVTIKAVATFSSGRIVEKTATVTLDNSGPPIAFAEPTASQVFSGDGISIALSLLDSTHTPVRVSFFRETASEGSIFLSEDKEAPFTSSFDVLGLSEDETVVIKAVATDAFGHTSTIQVAGSVQTNSSPVADAGADITVEQENASGASVALSCSGSTDPDGDALTCSWSGPFGNEEGTDVTVLLPPGSSTVSLVATDTKASTSADTVVVTVVDTTPPTVTAPAAVTVEATGSLTVVSLGSASATDLVDGTLVATASTTGPFALGKTDVVWTATDSAGNSASANQTVTVVDTTPPTVTAPAAVTVEATGALTAVTLGSASATDLVDGVLVATASTTGPFTSGETVVVWTATDSAGNSASATQTVTVVDTTPPTITAPAAVTVEATGALTAATLGSASASDLVDGVLATTASTTGPFALSETIVVWTATDSAGNSASANQTVTVVDTTPPTVTAPAAVTVEATDLLTVVSLGSASAIDLVDGSLVATPSTTGPFALGEIAVVWTATDSAGNSASATQAVTVVDTTPPVISLPANVAVTANGVSTSVAIGIATASDIFGPVTITNNAPTAFAPGDTAVTWTATDANGNSSTLTQVVRVKYSFEGFRSPLKEGGKYKRGRTLPIKFQVFDASGSPINSVRATIQLIKLHDGEVSGDPIELESSSAADTGVNFRYTDEQYIYNLNTKMISAGYYQISALLDDGTSHIISVGLVK